MIFQLRLSISINRTAVSKLHALKIVCHRLWTFFCSRSVQFLSKFHKIGAVFFPWKVPQQNSVSCSESIDLQLQIGFLWIWNTTALNWHRSNIRLVASSPILWLQISTMCDKHKNDPTEIWSSAFCGVCKSVEFADCSFFSFFLKNS
jgi:hypothetical protein